MPVNKIIPVICIIAAALCVVLSSAALILMCATLKATSIAVVSSPFAIFSLCFSALSVTFCFMFKKDRLCRVALIVNIISLALSAAAVIIWLVAL